MILRRVHLGEVGVIENYDATHVLLEVVEDMSVSRAVMTPSQARSVARQLENVAAKISLTETGRKQDKPV